jgi:hypothetical protein
MTPQEEREFVEAAWERIDCKDFYAEMNCVVQAWAIVLPCRWSGPIGATKDDPKMWHAAFLFTQERLRQIAAVEKEIDLIEYCRDTYYWCEEEPATIARILAVERQRLADLRKGLK